MTDAEIIEAANSDPLIMRQLDKIKKIRAKIKEDAKIEGNLMARVMLRRTGAIWNERIKGYTILQQDLFAWFENADYLRDFTEYDTL